MGWVLLKPELDPNQVLFQKSKPDPTVCESGKTRPIKVGSNQVPADRIFFAIPFLNSHWHCLK